MKNCFIKVTSVILVVAIMSCFVAISSISVNATQNRTSYFNRNYSLSGNPVDDIVSVAMAQNGRKQTEMGYSEAWCADFVSDCADLAGVRYAIPRDGYCGNLWDNIIGAGGTEVYSPQKGDIIFYYCTASYCPKSGAPWVHVGIMTSSSSSIEGNSGGKVTAKSSITYKDTNGHTYGHSGTNLVIVKYLRPKYSEPDNNGPVFDNFHVGEIQSDQFTILAHVTDSSGLSSVRYAVWTENNGQDDIKWYDGHCTDGNDYYWSRVKFSDHNNEKGRYIIHMYAYDNAGNLSNPGISYKFDSTGPSYTDFRVGELRKGAFTVLAKVTDVNGVSSVRYAVWTEKNGQDDIKWYDGKCTDNNDYYWAHVHFSEHNNEKGKYIVHMYAYDTAGKLTNPGIEYDFGSGGPSYSDFHVGEFRTGAFTVMAKVTDITGVSSVRYAVWTEKNGQDDIKWYDGKCTDNNDYYWAHVNFSEHNNEEGNYIIHMYAYDKAGNLTNPGISYDFSAEKPTEAPTEPTTPPTEPPTSPPTTPPTEPPTVAVILLGDVDGDDEVTIIDATCIQRKLVELSTAKFIEAAADADEDGELSIIDATVIQRWLVQLPSNENIGKPIS